MVRLIGITAAISLAIGAIGGYWLQRLDSQPIAAKPPDNDEAIAQPVKPKQVDLRSPEVLKRSELLTKYKLCTSSKVVPQHLETADLRTLNDLVYAVCVQVS